MERASWEGVAQPKWCMRMGRTWWDCKGWEGTGPRYWRERADQDQKSREGLGGREVCGFLHLGREARWGRDGWM